LVDTDPNPQKECLFV